MGRQRRPGPVYDDHVSFFREYLAPRFARAVGIGQQHNWCADWQLHPEADTAINALWRAWEDCTNPDRGRGLAYWLTMFAYPMMERLLGETNGTFEGCTSKHNPRAEPLATQ